VVFSRWHFLAGGQTLEGGILRLEEQPKIEAAYLIASAM
jgi:hypothetical protein